MEERGTNLPPLFWVKVRKRQLPPGGCKRGSLFISVGEGSQPLTRGRREGKKRDESRVEKRARRVRRAGFRTPPLSRARGVGSASSDLYQRHGFLRKLRELTQDHRREEKQLCAADFRLCTHHDHDPDATAVAATLETPSFAHGSAGTNLRTPG